MNTEIFVDTMNEKKLNHNQQKAAEYMGDALCILASAGCGKTTVLVAHYLELLKKRKLRPSQIVVTTFSEKSAADIKQKILQELERSGDADVFENPNHQPHSGGEGEAPTALPMEGVTRTPLIDEFMQAPISTLHSLAGRILRDSSLLLGLDPHFEILDENKAATLKMQALREVMQSHLENNSPLLHLLIKAYPWKRLENEFFEMLQRWPEWKEILEQETPFSSETPSTEIELKLAFRKIFLNILENYSSKKALQEVLDFNDLEEKSISLLQKYPWVAKHYQKQWKAYLVDEFQDTSVRQDILLSLLLNISSDSQLLSDTHLAIVGDPKQSIYGFRGSKAHIFEKYQSLIEKKGGLTVYLDENYRSPSTILDFVNVLFKPIFSNYSELKGPLSSSSALEVLQSEEFEKKQSAESKRKYEAERLAQHIQELIQEGVKPEEIYLLFRSSTPMPLYLKAFREKHLPVFIKSGESLLERQEIQDLLHAIRLIIHPQDSLAWVGLLRSPAFSISDETLLEYSLAHSQKPDWSGIHPLAQALVQQNKNISPTQFLDWWFEKTQLIKLYSAEPSLTMKAQNLLQFYHWSFEWEKEHSGVNQSNQPQRSNEGEAPVASPMEGATRPPVIEEFIKEIEWLIEEGIKTNALSDQLGSSQAITFMTIHQSKGLDLPVVILPDLKTSTHHSENKLLCCKSENSWGLRIPDSKPGLKKHLKASLDFENNLQKIYWQQAEEENRIFYVAATRSTQKLILGFLPSPPQTIKKEAPPQVRDRLAEICSSYPNIKWILNENIQINSDTVKTPLPNIEIFPHFSQNRILHFAVTELETFLRSPQEYNERFIQNISAKSSTPRFGQQKKSVLSSLERGQIFHEALCLFSESNNAFSPSEIIRNLAARHHWAHSMETVIATLESTFNEMIKNTSLQKILHAEEAYSEIPFRLQLEPFVIQGAMDRLIREKDQWKVIDYKTHTASSSKLLPPKEFEFQLKTYCLAASKMLHRSVQEAQIYFVMPHKTYNYLFNENELKQHEDALRNLMQEINHFVYSNSDANPNTTNIRLVR